MVAKSKDKKLRYFNASEFVISLIIWIFGAIISILPIFVSFIYSKSNDYNMDIYEYIFNSSDIMYACVSMVIVAVSDNVLGMFRQKKSGLSNVLNVASITLSIIYILFGSVTYTLYEYSSQEYMFMIKYNKDYFWIVVGSCILMYIYKNYNILEVE